jgi:hypothetical protein
MRLESGTGSIDHEVSIFLLGGENKEKTSTTSPLNKFDIKRYEEILKQSGTTTVRQQENPYSEDTNTFIH